MVLTKYLTLKIPKKEMDVGKTSIEELFCSRMWGEQMCDGQITELGGM
jgi:hypothetical protein